ncbi:hypothetical protein GF369_00965 [Candidatus Peregrinibacteria bacterium]|nr:hypothetical protein [Candidatus Peregrinibacteria bacterium]
MIIPAFTLFILGTMVGSFLSVINYRIRHNKSGILFGRSECRHCRKKLTAFELIPLISYSISRGKCRHCGKSISPIYPLLELISGLLLLFLYMSYPFIGVTYAGITFFDGFLLLQYIYTAFVVLCLIGILFYDIEYLEIPELYTFPAIAIIFVWGIFSPTISLYSMALGGGLAALFFGGQVMISKEEWLGSGDTQVGILMGLFLGWELFLVALMVTYFLGLLITLLLMALKKVNRKSKIPFAPFLVIGTLISLFYGSYLIELYTTTLL